MSVLLPLPWSSLGAAVGPQGEGHRAGPAHQVLAPSHSLQDLLPLAQGQMLLLLIL